MFPSDCRGGLRTLARFARVRNLSSVSKLLRRQGDLVTFTDFRCCGWATSSLPPGRIPRLADLLEAHPVPAVTLATCQRLEVYHQGACDCGALLKPQGLDALRHLAEVAAGLHSAVLGEDQILGQVRDAWANAGGELGRTGAIAIGAARRLRERRGLRADAGHLLDLALRQSAITPGGRIAVVGTGVLARRIAHRATEMGYEDVVIAGRQPLATSGLDRVRWLPLAELRQAPPVDVAVTCLGAGAPPLSPALHLPEIRRLLVDLGTPRNVTGEAIVTTVTIASILERCAPGEDPLRAELQEELHRILDDRLRPVARPGSRSVGELRAHVERLRQAEVRRIARLHPELESATIDTITHALVNRIFHTPSERLRELDDEQLSRSIAALFAPEGAL